MARTVRSVMDLHLLGHVEAGFDGHPLALGGSTQLRVLSVLVAKRGQVVDISTLVELCWPDGDPPRRAEHNVRTYVSRLRAAMNDAGDQIETIGSGYRLRLDGGCLDLDRYEQLAQQATRLIETGDVAEGLDRIAEAEQLWKGRPYGEFADEAWAQPEAVHLGNLRAAMIEQRAQALLDEGRPTEATGVLEQLIHDEPYRERPRALLMRSLYESGRHTEALRAFQTFRRFLVDEAGIEPSRELVELDRQIATGMLETTPAVRTVGNYELHERIGQGAFAVVHRATQPSLGREVAVKIVRAELADQPEFVRRFDAEARMVAAIEHPNVVPLYDYWREPGHAYLVMRWMTGGSLEQRLDDGRLELDAALVLVEQVADALDAAHRRGVVHRDVKPANIMFDDERRAYLGDFGIALAADERSRPESALSEGSPVFASPEQLRREPAGPEADVHALGIVAYTAIAGHTPFHDTSDETALLHRQLNDSIPRLAASRPDLPSGIDDVIAIATAKQPYDRFPTAGGFAAALRAGASEKTGPRAVTRPGPRRNPYRGLRAFTESDAESFHGRHRLVGELLEACGRTDQRLVAVVGASGSGKSSAVGAGLVPALRGGGVPGSDSWFLTTMVPGHDPFESLETALLRVAVNPPAVLVDQLRAGDRGILRGAKRILPDDNGTILLIIDQFEELFTTTSDDLRSRFMSALAVAIAEPSGSLRVVLTMRADFYDQPLRHREFATLFKQGTVAITPLAPDELEEVITAPAAAVGVSFEPGLVAEIAANVASQPGALPLLQYALTQSFEATDGDTITVDTYRSVGGLAGALARRAEQVYEPGDADERLAARQLFCRLVALGEGVEDTRRRLRLAELPGDDAVECTVSRFGDARLLTFDNDSMTREPTIEIAHEALIREWPRMRGWLDDDRDALRIQRHLTAAAAAWAERDRDPSELYRGARLEAAESIATNPNIALNEFEWQFIEVSAARRDADASAERTRLHRLRRLITATAIVAVVALVAGVVALVQWRRADDAAAAARASEREALEQSAESTAQRLAVQSADALADDPDLAINLALESLRLTDDAGLAPVDGAVAALHTATQSSRLLARFDTAGVSSIDPTGSRMLLSRPGGELVLVDAASGNIEERTSLDGEITETRYFPGGDRVAAATGESVTILDVDGLSRIATQAVECCVWAIEPESRTGRVAVWSDTGVGWGTTEVLDASDLRTLGRIDGVEPAGWADGELIVFGAGQVEAVDVATGGRRPLHERNGVKAVDVSPDGSELLITTENDVTRWHLEDGGLTHVADLDIDVGVLTREVRFGGDGTQVTVEDAAGLIDVFDLTSDARRTLPGQGAVWHTSTDSRGQRLLASAAGEALLWDLSEQGPPDLGAIPYAGNVWEIGFSTDGAEMYVSDSRMDGARVRAIDRTDGSTIATVDGFGPTVGAGPVVTSSGLAAGWMGGQAPTRVVDIDTGETVATLDGCDVPSSIDADGRWMIVVCLEDGNFGNARVVDPTTGDDLMVLGPIGPLSAIGPPGTVSDGLVALPAGDGLWFSDLRTGREYGPVAIDHSPFRPFFSSDGRYVTFGSGAGGSVMVDVEQVLGGATGDEPILLNPLTDAGATSFSVVAGDYFVTGHGGEVLRFWETSDQRPVFELEVSSGDTTFLAPTPDGRHLYYEAEGQVLRRLPLDLDDLVTAAQERLVRHGFTEDECERFTLADDCAAFAS